MWGHRDRCGKLGRADSCLDGGTNNRIRPACFCLWGLCCFFWQQISLVCTSWRGNMLLLFYTFLVSLYLQLICKNNVIVWNNHWLLDYSLLGKCFLYSNGLMDHMCVCEDGSKKAWYKKPGNFQGTLVKRCFYLESLYVFCSYIYSSVWLSNYKGIKSPSYQIMVKNFLYNLPTLICSSCLYRKKK